MLNAEFSHVTPFTPRPLLDPGFESAHNGYFAVWQTYGDVRARIVLELRQSANSSGAVDFDTAELRRAIAEVRMVLEYQQNAFQGGSANFDQLSLPLKSPHADAKPASRAGLWPAIPSQCTDFICAP